MSAFDSLKKAETKSTKSKKSSAVEITNEELSKACKDVIKASKDEKNAKALKDQAGAEIIDAVSLVHNAGLENQTLDKTFRVNESVMVIFTDRFKSLSEDDVVETKEILKTTNNSKIFDRLFRETAKFSLKEGVADNEKLLGELIETLGDKMTKFFDVKISVQPVDDFYKTLVKENVQVELKDVVERLRYKPTLKVS
jgi:hypothetical protein